MLFEEDWYQIPPDQSVISELQDKDINFVHDRACEAAKRKQEERDLKDGEVISSTSTEAMILDSATALFEDFKKRANRPIRNMIGNLLGQLAVIRKTSSWVNFDQTLGYRGDIWADIEPLPEYEVAKNDEGLYFCRWVFRLHGMQGDWPGKVYDPHSFEILLNTVSSSGESISRLKYRIDPDRGVVEYHDNFFENYQKDQDAQEHMKQQRLDKPSEAANVLQGMLRCDGPVVIYRTPEGIQEITKTFDTYTGHTDDNIAQYHRVRLTRPESEDDELVLLHLLNTAMRNL